MTPTPIASRAKTSVVQCASKTIRVAATSPPIVQTKGAARGAAPEIADAMADMHRVPRRKGVVRSAGARNAMPSTMDLQAVQALLRNQMFQEMRQHRRHRNAGYKMVGLSTLTNAPGP